MRIWHTLQALGWALAVMILEAWEWREGRRDRRRQQTPLHPHRRDMDREAYRQAVEEGEEGCYYG